MADPRSKSRFFAIVLVPLAITVALLLVLWRVHLQPPTLPEYVVAEPAHAPKILIVPGKTFAIELRPVAPVEGAVSGRGFLLRGDEVRPWNPPVDVTRDGHVRIAGPVDQLFAGVPPGPWEVAVAVGRPEVLPTAPLDVLRARDDERAGAWHLVRKTIDVEPGIPPAPGPEGDRGRGMHGL